MHWWGCWGRCMGGGVQRGGWVGGEGLQPHRMKRNNDKNDDNRNNSGSNGGRNMVVCKDTVRDGGTHGGHHASNRLPTVSLLDVHVDVSALLNTYLGRHAPVDGKGGVLQMIAQHALGEEECVPSQLRCVVDVYCMWRCVDVAVCACVTLYAFIVVFQRDKTHHTTQHQRYGRQDGRQGGLMLLANAILLLVNFPVDHNLHTPKKYANRFLGNGNGMRITWFPGSGQRPGKPVSQRILAAGKTTFDCSITNDRDNEYDNDVVLLLCRATDARGHGRYVCCGRLRLVRWSWEGPREWEWELVDAARAAGEPAFCALLQDVVRGE